MLYTNAEAVTVALQMGATGTFQAPIPATDTIPMMEDTGVMVTIDRLVKAVCWSLNNAWSGRDA